MKREPYIRITDRSKMKISRKHADNGCRLVVNVERLPDDIFTAKVPLPPAIAEHRQSRRGSLVFTGTEVTSRQRMHSNGLEKIICRHGRRQQLRRARAAQQDLVLSVTGKPLKNLLLRAPVEIVRIRSLKLREYFCRPCVIYFHQPRCIAIRQRTQQRRVDKSKDCEVSGNAQHQSDKSDGGESRRFEQCAQFVTQVLQDGFHHDSSS